jgi:hypothetical protein
MPTAPTLLLALGGLIFLAVARRIRRADIASASWVPVSATVLSSDISPQEGGFTPSVSYRYSIGGETLVSTGIALTLVSTSSEASARATASRYPVGSPVIAFVNPQNDRQAILEPRPGSLLPITFLAAGLLLLGMCLYRLLAGIPSPP